MTRMDAIYAVYRSLPEDAQIGRDAAAWRLAEKKLTEERANKPDLISPTVWLCELAKKTHELWLWQMDRDYGQDIAALLSRSHLDANGDGPSWMSWTREDLKAINRVIADSVPLKVLAGGAYDKAPVEGYWETGRE